MDQDAEFIRGWQEGYQDAKAESAQDSYEEGYEQGKSDGDESGYTRGYEEGYDEGTLHVEAAREKSYEEGYADGEKMLYSKDNPLEVITEMEHEINMTLTAPTTASYEDTLKMIQRMCQSMLKDWGQYVNTGTRQRVR